MNPCIAGRYGEVTALIMNPSTPVITDSASDGSTGPAVRDANITSCGKAGKSYVGIAAAAARWVSLPGGWHPIQQVFAAASTPSARQRAAGQHWLACLVYLGADDGNPESFADQERYDGPLRAALSTGGQRNRIGVCVADADLGDSVGCATAHESETFAFGGNQTHAVSRADLQQSCARVVQQATGIPDVAAAGLIVQLVDNNGESVTAAQIPAGAVLSCSVTPRQNRRLGGSLLGLGKQPIP